ncbi:lipopolysaccharide heptosyltransferase I [Neisseria shayeganii]|uniref:Lipopolysaccharide heptosyltransferase 1 n=1 Tax=Neisseria shayeganii TaxID=607712 RepID=A0A7D7NBM5_9NEIS|nr:lipopolysaccharide heptosyltransferase I [Neisseria shayeganii]QMT40456.1 lipopolysaccharide heptosyltransferase I [Neisseria shayeganii]
MKILLVRLSSMGDLIHTLPAIQDLSLHQPEIELHWLTETAFADIPRLHPFVRKTIPMGWRMWRKNLFDRAVRREIYSLKQTLETNAYDFVLDSQGLLKSALFARMAKAPVKGFDQHSAREGMAAWFYRQGFQVAKGRDAVWRNRELFAKVFSYSFDKAVNFGIKLPSDAIVSELPQHFRVALHATSRDSKLWPEEHWIALLKKLHEQDGAGVWLPWGNEGERQRALRLADKIPGAWVSGRLDLLQTAYVLQQSAGVVGVDTGLLHLANGLDKPLIGIYTDTDPAKTGVQTSPWAFNLGGIGKIPAVDEVFAALSEAEKTRGAT